MWYMSYWIIILITNEDFMKNNFHLNDKTYIFYKPVDMYVLKVLVILGVLNFSNIRNFKQSRYHSVFKPWTYFSIFS